MSLLDVKILVIAAAEWLYLQCSSQIRPLNYSPPLSRQLLAVWKCVVEESMEKRKINALSKVKLCNALELTRLRGELPDVRVIAKVFIWLEKYGDPNGRMFKHYGHAIDDLENRTLNNIQSSHTFEPILPKKFDDISIEEESNLFKEIHELLTKKENLEVPESFNSSQSSTINCKKSEEDFKESATAMNPDELIAVATCSEENDGPKVVDVSADKVDIISQSSEDFSAPMVHQPLLKRLKNVADYRLAGSTVELIRVAAVCDLAQDPRRNGFFEAVQCSANNIRNEDRNKSESSHMETGDSTAYLTHFKGVLDDVGRRQYEKLMRMFAMTPPSAP
uniref:VHS domain-containing protein n=1 Tax=Syphacia muris TaxID=451379 RepID=A0A0N5ANJ6_9BILA